jgi:hypothetical protein
VPVVTAVPVVPVIPVIPAVPDVPEVPLVVSRIWKENDDIICNSMKKIRC